MDHRSDEAPHRQVARIQYDGYDEYAEYDGYDEYDEYDEGYNAYVRGPRDDETPFLVGIFERWQPAQTGRYLLAAGLVVLIALGLLSIYPFGAGQESLAANDNASSTLTSDGGEVGAVRPDDDTAADSSPVVVQVDDGGGTAQSSTGQVTVDGDGGAMAAVVPGVGGEPDARGGDSTVVGSDDGGQPGGDGGGEAVVRPDDRSVREVVGAPSTPQNVVASRLPDGRLELAWEASSDDVGVAEYHIYLNGVREVVVSGDSTSAAVKSPPGVNTYLIRAIDDDGNESNLSLPASAHLSLGD